MWLPDPTDQHFESKYISVGARCNVKVGMTRLTAEPFSREHTGRGTAQGARQNQSLSGEPKLSGGRSTKQHMTVRWWAPTGDTAEEERPATNLTNT